MNRRHRNPASHPAAHEALVFSLLGTAGAVEARLEAVLEPLGLSLAKAGLLHHLAEAKEPVPLSELADHQHCVRSNITQLVDRLEKDGFVRRRGDPRDRRTVRAALTPAGQRAYAQAKRVLEDEQRAIMRLLSDGEAERLNHALRALAD